MEGMTTTPWARAVAFAKLHVPGDPIVLPNAWDPITARVIEGAGAKAIATSSAAVSWAMGRRDGNQLNRHEAIQAAARVAAATTLPVSADIETGYGRDEADLAVTVRALLDAGIVGINLEDSGGDPLWPIAVAARRVQVARAVAAERGIPLYVNARIDTYLAEVGDPAGRLTETLARAEAYLAAGASGIFVPHVADPDLISSLVTGIEGPLNVLVGPGSPAVASLADLGVARISTGSALAGATFAALQRLTREVLDEGTYTGFEGKFSYQELNDLIG